MTTEFSTGWFVVTLGCKVTYLRLNVSPASFKRATRRFLVDREGHRWTVRQRIG